MTPQEKARQLRPMIVKASAGLSDEDALNAKELYPRWEVGMECEAGKRYFYQAELYRCVQAHTSQAEWTPDVTPALWTEVTLPGEIEVWKQPTGAQDAYRVGARVHFPTKDDPVYENDVDYNVYAPNVTGWHEVI